MRCILLDFTHMNITHLLRKILFSTFFNIAFLFGLCYLTHFVLLNVTYIIKLMLYFVHITKRYVRALSNVIYFVRVTKRYVLLLSNVIYFVRVTKRCVLYQMLYILHIDYTAAGLYFFIISSQWPKLIILFRHSITLP